MNVDDSSLLTPFKMILMNIFESLKDILGEIIILKMNQSQIIFYFDNFGYELKI